MEVPVFLPASQILARLLTVDSDTSGLNANTLQGYLAADFALAGHTHSYQPLDAELTAIAGLTSAANTVPSFTGSGTAALLTVGTGASNLVQLTAAAKLPAVDGSLLTNLATGLAATGATIGATAQIQRFSYGTLQSVVKAIGTGQPGMVRGDSVIEFQTAAGGLAWDIASGVGQARFFNGAAFFTYEAQFYNNINMQNGGYLYRSTGPRLRINTTAISVEDTNGVPNTLVSIDPTGITTIQPRSAATNAVQNNLIVGHNTSGTPAPGYGVGVKAQLESSTTENQDAGRLTWAWNVATHASRASKGQLTSFYTSTERAAMTWGADASGPLLGFGSVTTPIAIPVLATGAAHTTEDIIAHLQSLGLARQS